MVLAGFLEVGDTLQAVASTFKTTAAAAVAAVAAPSCWDIECSACSCSRRAACAAQRFQGISHDQSPFSRICVFFPAASEFADFRFEILNLGNLRFDCV